MLSLIRTYKRICTDNALRYVYDLLFFRHRLEKQKAQKNPTWLIIIPFVVLEFLHDFLWYSARIYDQDKYGRKVFRDLIWDHTI